MAVVGGSISLGYDGAGKENDARSTEPQNRRFRRNFADCRAKPPPGVSLDAGKLTVGEYLHRWLENTAKNKVRSTTLERYEVLVRLHLKPTLGGVQLGKLRAVHIEECYAEMAQMAAPGREDGNCFNALCHAVRLKLIAFNPAADVVKARPEEKEMLFLTQPQTRIFLAAAENRRLDAVRPRGRQWDATG